MKSITHCFYQAIEWYRSHGRRFVWRTSRDWYVVLVAEFCLVRTRACVAERFVNELLRRYPTPQDLCRAEDHELYTLFRSIGLPRRGPALRRTVCTILERYGGSLPCSYDDLINLPGIGRYIASALMTLVCGDQRPFIDTNVVRVLRRVTGISSNDPTVFERILLDSGAPIRDLCLALIDIADAFCKPAKPRCSSCPLRDCCSHYVCSGGR